MEKIYMMQKIMMAMLMISSCISFSCVTLIGIAGGASSGKTTLAYQLQQLYPELITVISSDNYYYDMSDVAPQNRLSINFDHPDTIDFNLLYEHLIALKQGEPVVGRDYNFITLENKSGAIILPAKIIIVDGFLIFAIEKIQKLFDVKIFIETDDDVRLSRCLIRDQTRCGRTWQETLTRWNAMVNPIHHQFVQPSKCHADIIIHGNNKSDFVFLMLKSFITSLVHN